MTKQTFKIGDIVSAIEPKNDDFRNGKFDAKSVRDRINYLVKTKIITPERSETVGGLRIYPRHETILAILAYRLAKGLPADDKLEHVIEVIRCALLGEKTTHLGSKGIAPKDWLNYLELSIAGYCRISIHVRFGWPNEVNLFTNSTIQLPQPDFASIDIVQTVELKNTLPSSDDAKTLFARYYPRFVVEADSED